MFEIRLSCAIFCQFDKKLEELCKIQIYAHQAKTSSITH